MELTEGAAGNGCLEIPIAPSSPHLVLAVHHDRHKQLSRVFKAWKRRARVQCGRRKRVATACRVGAVFYQRIFWEKWRAFVAQERQEGSALKNTISGIENVRDNRERNTLDASYEDGDDGEFAAISQGLTLKKQPDIIEHDAVIIRTRFLHAIRRWKGFVRWEKDRDAQQQRAYFFLYYWLLKRSLSHLSRYALLKKKERTLIVKVGKANRRRLMVQAMQQWRLRLRLHQTLRLWRSYVQGRRYEALLYRPITEALTRMTHRRLLRFTFDLWEKQYRRIQGRKALVHLLDRHVYWKVCERVWKTWKTAVRQLAKLERFTQGYQERRLRRIWNVWSTQTREKQQQEQQRRRAVRHHYLSLLRKGFGGFHAGLAQRRLALDRVGNMQDAADHRTMALVFSRWDHFTSERKSQSHKLERAVRHYELKLLERVWSKGFRCFNRIALSKKKMLATAQEHNYLQTVRRSFHLWKALWRAERSRDQNLEKTLGESLVVKEQAIKARVFENWSEFARARAAKRVVNAQVRGQAQQRTLQTSFSRWVTFVSVLRWQQITQARAKQHYKSVLWRKCFERWHCNVDLRQLYRNKVRVALVHWKLNLERKAFDGWKQYLNCKRTKQQRIHEALEFRHEQFVRDGLRHWMTAALHLQEQREQQVARIQASNTAQVWRRVAAIARHWRYLAVRRRTLGKEAQTVGRSRKGLRPFQEDWLWQLEHVAPPPSNGKKFRVPFLDGAGVSNRTDKRSPLSEFVLIPRNRPQPRRPVEVLLFSQAATENLRQPNNNTHMNEALRCGFDFPAVPFTLSSPPSVEPPSSPTKKPSSYTRIQTREHGKRPEVTTTSVSPVREDVDPLLPNTTAQQLDILERKIIALSHRKKEWKVSQQQIELLREQVEMNPQLALKLRAMEEQHTVRTKKWLHTKGRIRSLAMEIQQLRSALQG